MKPILSFRPRLKTNYIVVHDSHTPPELTNGLAWLRARGRENGLLEIGYHAVIERCGAVHQIRPYGTMGSHTPGHNHESIGLCLVGGIGDEEAGSPPITGVQQTSLRTLLARLAQLFPEARIVGHSELQRSRHAHRKRGHARCPCLGMNEVRAAVAARLETP